VITAIQIMINLQRLHALVSLMRNFIFIFFLFFIFFSFPYASHELMKVTCLTVKFSMNKEITYVHKTRQKGRTNPLQISHFDQNNYSKMHGFPSAKILFEINLSCGIEVCRKLFFRELRGSLT